MAALDAMIALFKGSAQQVEYMVKCGALYHTSVLFSCPQMAALDAMIALFKGSAQQVEYMVKCGALQHLANEFHYSSRKCGLSAF